MSTSPLLKSDFLKVFRKGKTERNKNKYRNFNLSFLLAIFSPLFLAGLFNIIVDPYDVFDTPNFLNVNSSKPHKDKNDRLFKALDIIRIKPVTILLGSSRTKQGLDPNHPALVNNNNHQPAYNLGLNGLNLHEELRYLQHAIANQKKLTLVIIGIDFFSFNAYLKNQVSFDERRLEKQYLTPKDFINVVFSLNALSASQETIIASIYDKNKDSDYGENGFMPYRNIKKNEVDWRFKSGITDFFQNHAQYNLSKEHLEDFKKIVSMCKQNNITLKVFISPSHATQWEAIRATGHWQTFEQWKRELVKITPVWDFSGYNSVTTEPISYDMQDYTDNSHYTPKIGNLVLNRLLSYQDEKVPNDFGILITSDNVESQLVKIRADREIWATKNSDEVKLVQQVKYQYDANYVSKKKQKNNLN
ncbi:MAG TPA: hypothetical protein V6C95_14290 [Coleofasciculaceae cyanobacterium]